MNWEYLFIGCALAAVAFGCDMMVKAFVALCFDEHHESWLERIIRRFRPSKPEPESPVLEQWDLPDPEELEILFRRLSRHASFQVGRCYQDLTIRPEYRRQWLEIMRAAETLEQRFSAMEVEHHAR